MASTKRTEYKNNWQKEHTDRINLTVPIGQKEVIRDHAQARGERVNGFINRAISETIRRDQEKDSWEQLIAQAAAENNRSIEDVCQVIETSEALKVLEREVPEIREIYFNRLEKRRLRQRLSDRA